MIVQTKNKTKTNKYAFTLVELIVSITIVAILASI
ncbi:prepilin-type N-terminal cleavage/methylation domain-containing protein [bacterium]|nr:prepilin-type N-terminal cleavage/methylation domain-containing protein [bacterium]MBT3852478.1 prepilin-type N-terminal cleavage/methylation domain-containing protein [bacterium]MBT4632642.1 prepilin-type N-terminal cleavage/methylation domain-containing protein [bacterium]MBT6778338.1 prepilin-type N-terminal cleavage/methylation domain-containing protein [bacterium]